MKTTTTTTTPALEAARSAARRTRSRVEAQRGPGYGGRLEAALVEHMHALDALAAQLVKTSAQLVKTRNGRRVAPVVERDALEVERMRAAAEAALVRAELAVDLCNKLRLEADEAFDCAEGATDADDRQRVRDAEAAGRAAREVYINARREVARIGRLW